MQELQAIGVGGLVTSLALVACHIGFWGRLHPIGAYVVGVLCLLAGTTIAAALLRQPLIAYVAWAMAIIGGGTVVTCWLVRSVKEHWPDRDRTADRLLEITRRGSERKPHD